MNDLSTSQKNINVVQSKSELGSGINFNIEGIRKTGCHLIINGWMVDPGQKVASVVVRFSKHGKPVDLKSKFVRFPRKDVNATFNAPNASLDTHYGFVVMFDDAEMRHVDSLGVAVVALSGQVFAESYKVSEIDDPSANMPELLGIISGDQIRSDYCEKFFEPLFKLVAQSRGKPNELLDVVYGSPDPNPTLSVIIPLYGSTRFETVQIPSLAALHRNDWEIILAVDDPVIIEPVKRNAKRLASLYGISIRLVAPDQNLGFSGINNFAAKRARAEKVLFLNSDCFIGSDTLINKAVCWLDRTADAGAAGFRLFYADRCIQHDGMSVGIWNEDENFLLNQHPRIGMPANLVPISPEEDGTCMLTAACLLLNRKRFEMIGGFDSDYYRGDFEDSDLCLKLISNGLKLGIVRSEGIFHLERQTIVSQEGGVRQKITLINSYIYTKKWRNLLKNQMPALEVIA